MIHSAPREVYEAFADPQKIGNFWFGASSGRWEPGTEVILTYPEMEGIAVPIRVTEMIPGEKIVYLWGEEAQERQVTISIHPAEDGGEVLVRVTEGPWPEEFSALNEILQNKEGWVFMLTCLKAWLENGVSSLRMGIFTKEKWEDFL